MRRFLLLSLSLAALPLFGQDVVRVAAAANLTFALRPVDAAFEKANAGIQVQPVYGASGALYEQILRQAPYDVFLSADTAFPKKLVAAQAAGSEPRIFVRGRLALWTVSNTLALTDIASAIRSPQVRKIAIAQPKTAPYGAAAMAVLDRLGLTQEAAPKIVFGESISQAFQFVQTGNAEVGFVALSLILAPALTDKGHWIEVPASLYPPLDQAGVLTLSGKKHAAAQRYLAFLSSPEARAQFSRAGYSVP